MRILIKNATVVFPTELRVTNVLIEGTKIVDVDPPETATADEVVEATGKHLLPGVIDDQVHFREPGLTHKEDLRHASRACAKGGVTSFLEMPNTIPNATTQVRLNEKLEIASRNSLVNYGFYIGATPDNIDDLQHAVRTPGIKIFIGSSTGDLLVDGQSALERIFSDTRLPICAHCEDESTVRQNSQRLQAEYDSGQREPSVADHSRVRDHRAAVVATTRAIDLATRHSHPFHVLHVSTADEIDIIRNAPDFVTAEVCPHHLFFNVDDYARLGSLVKMNPSIKTRQDNQALWQALIDGTIPVLATDHAPHTMEEKQQPYPQCPSGLPAVENYLALMLNEVNQGRMDLVQLAQRMSTAPARIWRMKGKGKIEVGADADLVLVDMNLSQTIRNENQQTKCKWSPWHGTKLRGWPVMTWVCGKCVMKTDGNEYHFDASVNGTEIEFSHD